MPSIAVAPATQTSTQPPVGTLKLRATSEQTPAFMKDLQEKGYVVVKNVIPRDRADKYVSRAYDWLEGFNLGFDRNDRSTWHAANLPPHNKGGLYNQMGIGHQQFLWDIRSEPGLIDTFAQLWGTEELLCSFDGGNFAVPLPAEEVENGGKPWPHVDQSPLRRFMHCVQGIANLLPNGENDGGLMVFEGSFPLYKQFFDEHEDDQPEGGWPTHDSYHHTASQLKWFEEKGCKWKHVDAGPGDIILWDSRLIHYGARPTSDSPRMATYVCYKPASLMQSPEKLEEKKKAFAESRNTSHDPCTFRVVPIQPRAEAVRTGPYEKPVLSERMQKMAGLVPY